MNRNSLRNDFGLYDTRDIGNVEFEEEEDDERKVNEEDEEESEASWQKKSGSDESSDGFRKPVDFGIDKEISYKLDKLSVILMVGKENKDTSKDLNSTANQQHQHSKPEINNLRNSNEESAPTTSLENQPLDSPTRNYVKAVLGIGSNAVLDEADLKKSFNLDSIMDEKSKAQIELETTRDLESQLKVFKESLER